MRRRLTVLSLILTGALVVAAPASAQSGPAWGAIADRMTTAMEALQQPDGSFPDYLSPAAQPYAEAMIGYGLMLHGVRRGDHGATEAGLRAIDQTVQPGIRGGPRLDSVFKQLAVAAAYRLGRTQLSGDPAFESRRPAIEAWLQQMRPIHLTPTNRGLSNKHLVEAVADLELILSGLRSGDPGTVSGDPADALARVITLVDRRWPALVGAQSRPGPFGATAVASDPPSDPLAYHGLALAMYQRAIDLLGPEATGAARVAAERMARGSALLAAPDGDLAYSGRSQEQSWALALTAAGAGALDADGLAGRQRAERLRTRTAARVVAVHGFGPYGVWIVPVLRTDPAAGRAAMDDYAANGVYNGLTLVGAEWMLAALPRGDAPVPGPPPTAPLGADRNGVWRIDRGPSAFAVSRQGASWFAVRLHSGTGVHRGDPRYAFGLMAAKRLGAAGWRDVVPAAPRSLTPVDPPDPALRLRNGMLALPYGNHFVAAHRPGAIAVVGGFRTPSGRVVRHGVRFVYAPTPGGAVGVSFSVRRGDAVEVADYRTAGRRPITVRLMAHGGKVSRVVHSARSVQDGFASAIRGREVRVTGVIRIRAAGTLTWVPRG